MTFLDVYLIHYRIRRRFRISHVRAAIGAFIEAMRPTKFLRIK